MSNPYQTPEANTQRPPGEEIDTSSPFSPKGRFSRLSYIAWAFLFSSIAGVVEQVLIGGFDALVTGEVSLGATGILGLIIYIGLIVITILFAIRRLHDFGKNGWWLLLWLIPVVNIVFGLYMLLKRGDERSNQYGGPRPTKGWEKIVGYIAIGLLILGLVAIVAALLIPALAP